MKTKNPTAPDAGEGAGLSFPTRHFGQVEVITLTYENGGGLAVALVDEQGEPITVLSVNLPEFAHQLGEAEFFAKTWSENAPLADDALASGIFRDTGRTSGGCLNAQIWTFG